jgi:outer membrane protein assembly factor BamD (BamD/ComL family)
MIRRTPLLLVSLSLVVGFALESASRLAAVEPYREFLAALEDRGYGEAAVDYVKFAANRPDLPDEIRAILDLEMARALRVSAQETTNVDEQGQRLADAQGYLEKFLREHPDTPDAAAGYTEYGDVAYDRGKETLARALIYRPGEQQEAHLAIARQHFVEARPRFVKAVGLYRTQIAALPVEVAPEVEPPAEPAKKTATTKAAASKHEPPPLSPQAQTRLRLEGEWLDARFKLASVDYSLARTYTNTKAPERKQALENAAREFDGVYQQYRTVRIGIYAHVWHGKTLDELGDLQSALDVYDEVLANAPEKGDKRDSETDELFAEVEQYRLEILARQGNLDDVIAEADDWIKANRGRHTAGASGVALQLAKAQLIKAEKLEGNEKRKLTVPALASLAELGKLRGGHQREAILLRRQYAGETGQEIKTIDEALAVAEAALESGGWDEATLGYHRALELAKAAGNADVVETAEYKLARVLLLSGKPAEAFDAADKLSHANTAGKMAPLAASLAVTAAWDQFVAKQEPAAAERVRKAADDLIRRWPERGEADDARLALGKLSLLQGNFETAAKAFEGVNISSDRYPSALYLAAQASWRMLLEARKKAGPEHAADFIPQRTKIVAELARSIEMQRRELASSAALPPALLDALLLLGEVQLDAAQPREAIGALEPVVKSIKARPTQSADLFTLRALFSAMRAYGDVKDYKHAGEAAELLLAAGGDNPQVNGILLAFVQVLKQRDVNLGPQRDLVVTILEQLAKRQQHSLAGFVFIGDSLADMGLKDEARQQYQLILEKLEKDPALAKVNAKAVTRVRAQLVGLLQADGDFEAALKQVDRLMADNPRSLEPQMTRGRILQSWAESEPSHYDEAVSQWTRLRTILAGMKRKPPEYYETVYNAAFCLASQPDADKTRLTQAEQLLKSTLILSPELSGPEMVAKYNALLARCAKLQGRKS